MAPHFPEVADAAEDASENAKWSCNHLPNFGVFSPSGVLASPNCKHKSYSGMVAHTSCDLLAGVVVEEQEMDAIFPRSHLAVPTCTNTCTSHLPPVVCAHTCTNASVPHLYAHTLYHHLRICICICITTFICNRRTQFPHYLISKEDHIIVSKKYLS